MKVNFGILKNNKIIVPKNTKMRPTTSMVKSIIFDTLKHFEAIEDSLVLDLFAGTGLLGIESLSLEAKKVYFCDNNIESIKTLKENLTNLKIEKEKYKIIKNDFRKIISNSNQDKFDLIFLDPPFGVEKYFDESLNLIYKNKLLSKNGILVLEKPFRFKLEQLVNFDIVKQKKVGEKDVMFLKINYE